MVEFIASTETKLEFYFDTDYTIEEMKDEIKEHIMKSFWCTTYTELEGDWTRVPVIRHKLKLVHCPGLWDK